MGKTKNKVFKKNYIFFNRVEERKFVKKKVNFSLRGKSFCYTIFPLLRALCLPPTGYYLPGSLSVVYHFSWEMAHEFACIYFHNIV